MAVLERTHYDVLGIARDADAAQVRSAWKLHVQAWHPDRFTGEMREEAERQTARINEAYTTLRDASRRAAYDCRLAADAADERRATEPTGRMHQRARTAPLRSPAARVGSPIAVAEPVTLGEQLAEASHDAIETMRRHPRILLAAIAVLVLVFGGSAILHAVTAPQLPSAATTKAAAHPPVLRDVAPADDLADLAEQARKEAAVEEARMQELMKRDAAQQAAQDAADAKAAALAAAAARTAGKPAAGAAKGAGRRILRVMPAA